MITDGGIPAAESTAAQALGPDLTKHFEFLRDISTQTGNTVLSRIAGAALGYGTAKLEDGDLAAAAKQLSWLVQESSRYEGAPGSTPRR
ncbi:hypothetical protein [Streptomyces goshikiensis]|uniref:hypothetical protein n=1 Tax=Streptomyces goshikiensis TaxID=1942 RepID=UPI00368B15D6